MENARIRCVTEFTYEPIQLRHGEFVDAPEEERMDTIVKSVVTAAVAVAIAWPLLFWGEAALPEGDMIRQPSHLLTLVDFRTFDRDVAEFLGAW